MNNQVNEICKSGFYHIRNLRRIRKFLNSEQANVVAHAFVTSKLDYGNALLGGAPKFQINKLQLVQNAAARVIKKVKKYDSISDSLKELKWLPVGHRIMLKHNTLTWKVLYRQSPKYISDMIVEKACGNNLRSGETKVLNTPRTNLKSVRDKASIGCSS